MTSNFKTFALVAGSVATLALGTGTAARADDAAPAFGYTLSVIGVSDYIFRGISFTEQTPAFQPYLELTYGIGYVGFWGSNISSGPQIYGPWEFDTYAGIRPVTGPVNWDIGVLYYQYGSQDKLGRGPGGHNAKRTDLDYVEFKIAATTTPVENLTLGLTGYATPDQGYAVSDTWTIEGSANYTLPAFKVGEASWVPTVGGILGYTSAGTNAFYGTTASGTGLFQGDDAYLYWNAGLKLAVDKYFMDFRYWDTNITASSSHGTDLSDARFVFTAGVNLP